MEEIGSPELWSSIREKLNTLAENQTPTFAGILIDGAGDSWLELVNNTSVIADLTGKYGIRFLNGVLQQIINGTATTIGSATPTIQADDPTGASATGWYMATTSGDTFYKSDDGLFNVSAGTYTADTTTPTLTSATIPTAGTSVTLVFSEVMAVGAEGNGGWTLNSPTNAMTYASGSGTNTIVFNLASTILDADVPTISYTQPGNGWESNDDHTDLASIVAASVTNSSTQVASGLVVTDTFDGTESPLATNWTTALGMSPFAKTGGTAQGTNASDHSAAYWDADTFSANQYAKIVLSGAPNYHGAKVRANVAGAYIAYAHSDGTRLYVYRYDVSGAVWTSLVSGGGYITTTIPSGASIELRMNGSTPTVLINGTAVGTLVTDTTYAAGSAGVYQFGTAAGLASFEAGDL